MVERPRVLIALPNSVEAGLVAERLTSDGLDAVRRQTAEAAAADVKARRFDVLVADATMAFCAGLPILARAHSPRSVTILVGDVSAGEAEMSNSRTIYLARPLDAATVSCFVSMALIDGRPVRRSVRKPVNRFEASANGIRLHVVDVSAEGLRLEVSRESRAVLPPYFTVRIPIVGVAVTVRRMWTQAPADRPSAVWYGGELSHNRPNIDQAWRTFVDTMPAAEGKALHLAS